jgi:uncharacterized protein (DUF362 family)
MEGKKSRVILIRASGVPGIPLETSPETLKRMLETGLLLLTECEEVGTAWSRFFNKRDTIGIKVNCLGGRNMCTRPALARATAESLASLGTTPNQVIVWDRSDRELKRCGFPLTMKGTGSFRCFGTDHRGVGYEQDLTVQGSVGSRFSTLITRHCTAMINMPVLKDHGLCGVTGALKNTFGTLHNPNKYHEDRCNPYVADANAVPFVRRKNRLVICDAVTVQYKGGPAYHRKWVEPLQSILLSDDPVALDCIGAGILDRIRRKNGLPPLEKDGGLPAYLKTAADASHRLGRCRPEEIALLEKEISI